MPFCTKCGSAVEGRFCQSCGAPVTPAGAAEPPVAAPIPPAPAPAAPVAAARRNPLVWVLAGCLGLVAIGVAAALATGMFVFHKAREAGLDPALMAANPALAVTRVITTFNPDIEVLSVDEQRGIISVRQKSTGRALTLNFEDVKNGRFVFADENGEQVSIESGRRGEEGSFTVKTKEGTLTGGAQWIPPEWIPVYPGAVVKSGANKESSTGQSGAGYLTTPDAPEQVIKFYQDALRNAGFDVNNSTSAGSVATLSSATRDGKRSLNVIVTPSGDGTRIHITCSLKD